MFYHYGTNSFYFYCGFYHHFYEVVTKSRFRISLDFLCKRLNRTRFEVIEFFLPLGIFINANGRVCESIKLNYRLVFLVITIKFN